MALSRRRVSGVAPPFPSCLQSVVVIADAHIRGGASDDLVRFQSTLESIPQDTEALILLGDLFEVWVGLKHLQEPHHLALLKLLQDRQAGGLRIAYVEGNRDFYLHSLLGNGFDWVGDRLKVAIAGTSWTFVHGDRINPRDLQYRLWRKISRIWPVRFLFRLLPGFVGRKALKRIESSLARTNKSVKASFPEALLEAYLTSERESGSQNVVLGHFHNEYRISGPEGSSLWILPAWMGQGEWLQIDKEGARIRSGLPR